MIDVNRKGEVWVFAEQQQGRPAEVSLELLSKGRFLADTLGVKLAVALVGADVKAMVGEFAAYGADKVYLVQDKLLGQYQTNGYARVLCDLIHKYKPQSMLFGASAIGRDLAPRVASTMRAGLTADCTDLQIDDYTVKRTKEVHKDLLMCIRPAFGGNIIATIVNYDRWPQMATVREGVMPMPDRNDANQAEVIEEIAQLTAADTPLTILEQHFEKKKVDLKSSRVIVAGGAGIGSKENFGIIWDLAHILGGAPAGSRAAVDLGYINHDHQVGQTGTTVRPPLYIAVGISGAIQHCAGMQESAKIIAINSDPEASIMGVAHYGLVGDYQDIVPKMIKAIKAKA